MRSMYSIMTTIGGTKFIAGFVKLVVLVVVR